MGHHLWRGGADGGVGSGQGRAERQVRGDDHGVRLADPAEQVHCPEWQGHRGRQEEQAGSGDDSCRDRARGHQGRLQLGSGASLRAVGGAGSQFRYADASRACQEEVDRAADALHQHPASHDHSCGCRQDPGGGERRRAEGFPRADRV